MTTDPRDAELLATKLRIRQAMRAAARRQREQAATTLQALVATGRGVAFDPACRPVALPASITYSDHATQALDKLKPKRRKDSAE